MDQLRPDVDVLLAGRIARVPPAYEAGAAAENLQDPERLSRRPELVLLTKSLMLGVARCLRAISSAPLASPFGSLLPTRRTLTPSSTLIRRLLLPGPVFLLRPSFLLESVLRLGPNSLVAPSLPFDPALAFEAILGRDRMLRLGPVLFFGSVLWAGVFLLPERWLGLFYFAVKPIDGCVAVHCSGLP